MSTLETSALWPFAKYTADLKPQDLPADVLHAAKRCLLLALILRGRAHRTRWQSL